LFDEKLHKAEIAILTSRVEAKKLIQTI